MTTKQSQKLLPLGFHNFSLSNFAIAAAVIYVVYTVTKAYSKADKAMAAALAPVNQAYHDLRHSINGSHKVEAVGMDYYLSHYIDSDYRLDQGAYNIMYQVKENRPFLKKTLTWDLIVKPDYRHLIRQSNTGGS